MQFIMLENEKPPVGKLVLVWMGDFYGYGLRELHSNGDWYDEHNDFDDSEIEILQWTYLPAPEGNNREQERHAHDHAIRQQEIEHYLGQAQAEVARLSDEVQALCKRIDRYNSVASELVYWWDNYEGTRAFFPDETTKRMKSFRDRLQQYREGSGK